MKFKLKVMAVLFLLALMFFTISTADGATKVTIAGIGTATAKSDGKGTISWECEPTSSNTCTITLVFDD